MDIFSIDLTLSEIQLLRQSLDVITISGKDAKIIANLQLKLEHEIQSIQMQLQETELEKQRELVKAIETDKKKNKS
jgi:hypothetical protein